MARIYNFKVMEPASIEHLATLRAKSGEEIDREIYSFKDKGGRDVGLRFDLTVGMTRYVCSRKDLKLPAKLAAFGGMWRYDEPQYARFRWAHQWDLEIFGPPSVDSDAEVIDASNAILKRLGLERVTVKIGDRRVVEDFIRTKLRVKDQGKIVDLMRALDKVNKKTRAELEDEYLEKGIPKEQFKKLMELGELSGPPDEVLQKASALHLSSTGELGKLLDALNSRGVKNVEYSMSVVRGIDYYTGIVFEAVDNAHPKLGSLFGGGRYDNLPHLFGRQDLSATGAAGGVERESMSMGESAQARKTLAYVLWANDDVYQEAVRVLSELRGAGASADMARRGRSLAKQFEEADASGVRWALIVGKRELSKGLVTLRNLAEHTEVEVPLADAVKRMS